MWTAAGVDELSNALQTRRAILVRLAGPAAAAIARIRRRLSGTARFCATRFFSSATVGLVLLIPLMCGTVKPLLCGQDACRIEWTGKVRLVDWHHKHGTSINQRRCLRIDYFWDDQLGQPVIAHMPSHRGSPG